MSFELNDFIVLTVRGKSFIYRISSAPEQEFVVSLYFANKACKREIISKWIPIENEKCKFITNNKEVFVDNFSHSNDLSFFSKNKHFIKSLDCISNEFSICEPFLGERVEYLFKSL